MKKPYPSVPLLTPQQTDVQLDEPRLRLAEYADAPEPPPCRISDILHARHLLQRPDACSTGRRICLHRYH